jgi:serine/threonine protein phosphatase PrpC
LQARYGNKPTEGACAIAAIVTTSGLVTINLGDSYAFLVTCNGKKSKTEQLNKVLHKPNILEEQKRLEKFHQEKIQGGASDWLEYVTQDYSRLKASYSNGLVIEDGFKLSLTGAFGDTDHENSGLRHDPDVYFHSYEDIYKDIEDAEGACLIITCDGVMEKSNDAKWIGAMVAANSEKSPDEIAKALTEQAKKNGSHDNISIVVVKLKALLKQDQRQMNECSYFIVCDGHGGGQIAEEVCKHFGEVLSEKVNQKRQEVARSGKRRREEESKSQEEKENEEPKNKLSRTDETVKTNEKNGKPSSPENPGANRYAQWGSPPSSPMNSDDEDEENEEKEKKEEEEQEEEEVTFNLSLGFSNFTG